MINQNNYSRIAGLVNDSIVDGPGIRFTVFYQGCAHHCKNCHNPETWNFDGGKLVLNDEIVAKLKRNPLLQGITLSGGDPFYQIGSCLDLVKKVRESNKELDVIVYTGFLMEELLEMSKSNSELLELLNNIDIIIDGPYVDELRDLTLLFRGSSNQRIIDVKNTLKNEQITTLEW